MRFVDEYRDPEAVKRMVERIHDIVGRPWRIMEVCGGQTHAIVRHGLDTLLPDSVTLLHGPGCPVCVTPIELIDQAISIAGHPNVIVCSYGDMLRVPGSGGDLFAASAAGGDIRVVYSPLEAVEIARLNPDREVVFFAVGFETTAPANGMAVLEAARQGLSNFSVLVSHALVPPAMRAILSGEGNKIDGFLAAGHVCTIMGYEEYFPIAAEYHVPVVITGFEPLDILEGLYLCLLQLEHGRAEVENQYARSVTRQGNASAQAVLEEVFCVVQRGWRGIGEIPASGLGLSNDYARFDATTRFEVSHIAARKAENGECISGEILQGLKKPPECRAFGVACTPESPLGATMVSSEGACAAYYRYRNMERQEPGGRRLKAPNS